MKGTIIPIVTLRESKKKDKYLDLASELKNLLKTKLTIIAMVSVALYTVTEVLLKRLEDLEIRGLVETIQITALLRSVRILKTVQGLE